MATMYVDKGWNGERTPRYVLTLDETEHETLHAVVLIAAMMRWHHDFRLTEPVLTRIAQALNKS